MVCAAEKPLKKAEAAESKRTMAGVSLAQVVAALLGTCARRLSRAARRLHLRPPRQSSSSRAIVPFLGSGGGVIKKVLSSSSKSRRRRRRKGGGGGVDEPSFQWEGDGVWRKEIMMGDLCQPLEFSGHLLCTFKRGGASLNARTWERAHRLQLLLGHLQPSRSDGNQDGRCAGRPITSTVGFLATGGATACSPGFAVRLLVAGPVFARLPSRSSSRSLDPHSVYCSPSSFCRQPQARRRPVRAAAGNLLHVQPSNTIYYDAEGRRLEQPPTLRSLLRRPLPASVMLAKANAGGH
ncbi:hypothetical protein HU200_017635 [Digitaria exilis]|uniref:Uncharacterized protein n=1 Tax=Digitaria exilis TaxID=1010633 RepID=A0A835F6E3_9POAL|nr:hypothetical protein HU200_017635 [Digitaria exilis]